MPIYVERPEIYEAYQWLPEDLESVGRLVAWLEAEGLSSSIEEDKSLLIKVSNPKAKVVMDMPLFTEGRKLEPEWWVVKHENFYDEIFYFVVPPDKFKKRFSAFEN